MPTSPASSPTPTIAGASPYIVSECKIAIHPALDLANYPVGSFGYAGAQSWVNDQNAVGSGSCMQSNIPTLLAAVDRHEGIQVVPNSHPGVGNQVFAQLSPQSLVEVLYTDKSDDVLRRMADSAALWFLNGGAYRAAQGQFDQQDYPIVFGSAGCAFDFNPYDN